MKQLNSHTRKSQTAFEYSNFLNFEIHTDFYHANNLFSSPTVLLDRFEELIADNSIVLKKMKRSDTANHIIFQVNTDSSMKINIKNNYYSEKSNNSFKVNNELLRQGQYNLKKNDTVEIIWDTILP